MYIDIILISYNFEIHFVKIYKLEHLLFLYYFILFLTFTT